MITLTATPRDITGKNAQEILSKEGKIPAVVYGPSHKAENVTVSLSDFERILRHEGESTVIEMSGLGTTFQALIKDIERDPVTHIPRHVDFYAVKKGAKVTVSVPLSFVGESEAETVGASIVKVMHELEVEADPSKLPHEIEVSIESLAAIGDQIHVRDIKLPTGVTTEVPGDEVVALAQEVKEEAEEGAVLDMSAIEVEAKGKTEEAE